MYLHEPTYDLDELFARNYHIHTFLSRCGRKEMTLPAIVRAARAAGLKEIALTDHIHPGEIPYLRRNRGVLIPALEEIKTEVKVILGTELSAYGERKFSLQYAKDSDFPAYRLYAHNHYHMDGWEQPEDPSPAGYKEHMKRVLRHVLQSGRADCMAHPFLDRYIVREFEDVYGFTPGCITRLWTDNELGDLISLGKENGVAWELNTAYFQSNPDFFRRYFHIGKEIGACFHVGTDAHTLEKIDPAPMKAFFRSIL